MWFAFTKFRRNITRCSNHLYYKHNNNNITCNHLYHKHNNSVQVNVKYQITTYLHGKKKTNSQAMIHSSESTGPGAASSVEKT